MPMAWSWFVFVVHFALRCNAIYCTESPSAPEPDADTQTSMGQTVSPQSQSRTKKEYIVRRVNEFTLIVSCISCR